MTELLKFQKNCSKIIQKQLQMIKTYLESDISPEERQKNYWQSDIKYNSIIMEYQKINLLDNTPNQPSKFKTKNRVGWVGINDEAGGTYNTNSQIRFETSMLQSSLCDDSDPYILVSWTITVAEVAAGRENNNIEVVFTNCLPFTDCISKINNTQMDNAKSINVLMPMYNLIEYSDNYSKASGGLWQYYRD